MKQDSALNTQIPEDRVFLCRTMKLFAGVQITTNIKYNSSKHCSYAHGNHVSSRRDNWKAGLPDLWAIPQWVKYICIGIVGFGCPERALQHSGTSSLVIKTLWSILYECWMCPIYTHLLGSLKESTGYISQFLTSETPVLRWRWSNNHYIFTFNMMQKYLSQSSYLFWSLLQHNLFNFEFSIQISMTLFLYSAVLVSRIKVKN